MKFLSSVLCLAALVNLAASKISNAVPSAKSHHADSSVQKVRPARDLQFRVGEPIYTTLDELQRASPAYQPFAEYSYASPRTCGLLHKKKEPVQIQPVYIPVQQTPQCQQYQHVTVPITSYQQVSVPHTEYHQVTVPHTEYQQVSVPVHQQYQYHSVQQYYPAQSKPSCLADLCSKSADGTMRSAAELPAQWYGSNAEYVNPALESSTLYQAIGKSMASAYDMSADINRNAQYLAPEINANAQYQETGKSAQMYQMNTPSLELSRQAQYQPDEKSAYAQMYENAGVSEMKSAIAPEMKSATVPEMKSAAAQDINRNAAYQTDGRAAQMYQMNAAADYGRAAYADMAYADMNQRSALIPEWNRNAAYFDMNQRSALIPEWGRNAYADMYQRDAIAPEWNRNAYADMSQRTALIPEWGRNAMYQADERSVYAPAVAPEWSRNAAYADLYQRDAIAPTWSRNAAVADLYQRDAIAPEWGRNALYADMYQRDAIAPEWSRNAMYQPDGKHAYADVYKWSAPGRSGLYLRPQGFNRNAELSAVEKSTPMVKAAAAPESKSLAAPENKPVLAMKEDQADSAETTPILSPIKGKSLTESHSEEEES